MPSDFFKDIPTIRDALKIPIDINILKGRSNYICQLRMENSLLEGQFLNKDHSTVLHSLKNVKDLLEVDKNFKNLVEKMKIFLGY